MKLEKLLTLSQFVDNIKQTKYELNSEVSIETFFISNLGYIYRYDDFLNQPLKKEMFANDIPVSIPFETSTDKDIWIEREKKVIFKDFSTLHKGGIACLKTENETYNIEISEWTLYGLAQLTNGELELKNVEL